MSKQSYLETARLRLRPRERKDLDTIVEMDLDPDVYRYCELSANAHTAPPTRDVLRKRLRGEILSGSQRVWIIEWKNRSGLLGLVGLNPESPGVIGLPFYEGANFLGFRLIKDAWGQGIGTEAASAVLGYGFRILEYPMIAAFSHRENKQSYRVLEKIGMEQRGRILVPQKTVLTVNNMSSPCNVYVYHRLDRGTYCARASEAA
jgi:RimJ/RimL family protein N-acetyltransferase